MFKLSKSPFIFHSPVFFSFNLSQRGLFFVSSYSRSIFFHSSKFIYFSIFPLVIKVCEHLAFFTYHSFNTSMSALIFILSFHFLFSVSLNISSILSYVYDLSKFAIIQYLFFTYLFFIGHSFHPFRSFSYMSVSVINAWLRFIISIHFIIDLSKSAFIYLLSMYLLSIYQSCSFVFLRFINVGVHFSLAL